MAVRDYSKGKIYKIVVNTDEEYKPYVGSTIQGLAERMGGHRSDYKIWKNGKTGKCFSYDLFDKFGVDKCKIILLEEYPCDSKMKLLMKEREWYDKMECCNKVKPFINKEEIIEYKKEWYETNKEQILEQRKEYYETNKEEIAEKGKIYRDEYKEEICEKKKIYNQANKEKISEKKKEPFTCDCGSICRKSDKTRHERSLKHQNWLKSL